MPWFLAFLFVAMQMKFLLTFECSNNALLPYDGNSRVFRASGALTCSWVTVVPENYTVKLTISQQNVDSSGNTNCNNDYIQIRDGANSSGILLARLCNSYPGPSGFRSSGTQLWVQYKSTQASNSFEASFKKLLNPSFCPGNVISNGTSGSLSSPFYPANYPNDMECLWNITGPVGSRLILIFHRICFGICTNAMQPCGCDSLSINNVLKPRQLCLGSEVTPFISLENRISLSMVTDEQHTSKGFLAEYQSIFGPAGACAQMTQMTSKSHGWFSSPSFPSKYPNGVHCGWNISIPFGYKIYLSFLDFDLEKCGQSCSCDYVEVTRAKSGSSEKKCGTIAPEGWVVRNIINDNIVVTFKSDSQGNGKGFTAVYTFIPLNSWDSVPSVYCPWTDTPTTNEPITHRDTDISTDSIRTAIAQTAAPSGDSSSSSPIRTDDPPTRQRNSVGRTDWRNLPSLLVVGALSLLCLPR